MRLFLALNLPAAVRDAAYAAAAPLREAGPHVGWTRADNLHLTVKFLGEQADSTVAPLLDALAPVARATAPVLLSVGACGAFPNWRRPRVVWLGVRPDARLELLHHDVESVCAGLGFALDGRPFRPHVTLGRVRPRRAPPDPGALARAARAVQFRAEASATTLDLMRSEPAPGGSRYTPLASIALAGATRDP